MPLSAEKMREYRANNPKKGIQVLAKPETLAVLDDIVEAHGLTGRSAAVDLLAYRHDQGTDLVARVVGVTEEAAKQAQLGWAIAAQSLVIIACSMEQNRPPRIADMGGVLEAYRAANLSETQSSAIAGQ